MNANDRPQGPAVGCVVAPEHRTPTITPWSCPTGPVIRPAVLRLSGRPEVAALELVAAVGPEVAAMYAAALANAVVRHPAPGAKAGEVLAVGPGHTVVAYSIDGTMAAAIYFLGSLLRRDVAGWWTAGARGERIAVADVAVAALVGCIPEGWPCLVEQAPLLGAELLEVAQ